MAVCNGLESRNYECMPRTGKLAIMINACMNGTMLMHYDAPTGRCIPQAALLAHHCKPCMERHFHLAVNRADSRTYNAASPATLKKLSSLNSAPPSRYQHTDLLSVVDLTVVRTESAPTF